MNRKRPAFKFAVCIENEDYEASLELHEIYRVLADKDAEVDGDIRVIDESGEDYLYPADGSCLLNCLTLSKNRCCEPLDSSLREE